MKKASFQRVCQIVPRLTRRRVEAAAEEYKETRTTSDEDIDFLMQEMRQYGFQKSMSNESRIDLRKKIQSMVLVHGMPSFWVTVNPNDITNPVNHRLVAHRKSPRDGIAAARLVEELAHRVRRTAHVSQDPVSAALFFEREMKTFFKHYMRIGQDSVYGKVSHYFGAVEPNERGALHWHGLIWLHANMLMPSLLSDISEENEKNIATREKIAAFLDTVCHEVSTLSILLYTDINLRRLWTWNQLRPSATQDGIHMTIGTTRFWQIQMPLIEISS